MKPRIVIFMGRYLPGVKDGGPIQTIANLVEQLGDVYAFEVVCLDRDHGDTIPYPNIRYDQANPQGKASVWYYETSHMTREYVLKRCQDASLIYVCGPYSDYSRKVLKLHKQKKLSAPIVLASMGTFSQGALRIKRLKKAVYLKLLHYIGYFKNLTWSVTSTYEAEDLTRFLGSRVTYHIAQDLPSKPLEVLPQKSQDSSVRCIYLSRITPIKNLLASLEILKGVPQSIIFDVYGPIEDKAYWEQCQQSMTLLPKNIKVSYKGVVASGESMSVFSDYDAFLFPTQGENFGHVIYEALAVGCIPLISDQTPWQDLASHQAGYVFPVKALDEFQHALTSLIEMSSQKRETLRTNAIKYAQEVYQNSVDNNGYKTLFERLIKSW